MDRSEMRSGSSSMLIDSFHGAATFTEVIHEDTASSTASTAVSTASGGGIRLRLTKNPPRSGRRVSWTTDTVDNELMNKKKSKCCCVFQKAKNWDESSSEDENADKDCAHCKGHRKRDFNSQRDPAAATKSDKQESQLVTETENDSSEHHHHHHHHHDHSDNEEDHNHQHD